ncbi:MAG: hypothetical protein IKQ15_06800 [Kiritimatiellae bacterium]|nr:hypothetical protein [Kiritimatiellia bacterium]
MNPATGTRRNHLLSAVLLLAAWMGYPFAAFADIAVPPNDYTRFLHSQRPPVLPQGGFFQWWTAHAGWFALGVLALWGVFLIGIAARRKKPVLGREYLALGALGAFSLLGFFPTLYEQWTLMRMKAGWPRLMGARDTPELRAEYDRFCIEWYESWSCPDEALPLQAPYLLGRRPPVMRPGAPEAVSNAHAVFRSKLHEANGRLEEKRRAWHALHLVERRLAVAREKALSAGSGPAMLENLLDEMEAIPLDGTPGEFQEAMRDFLAAFEKAMPVLLPEGGGGKRQDGNGHPVLATLGETADRVIAIAAAPPYGVHLITPLSFVLELKDAAERGN